MDIKVSNSDSPKNCRMSWGYVAPMVFFRPISFERFTALAVDRFMKLKQAITRMKRAIRKNILTCSICVGLPSR